MHTNLKPVLNCLLILGCVVTALNSFAGTTTRILKDGGIGGVSISDDGRYVSFTSSRDDLVENDTNKHDDVFVLDRNDSSIKRVSVASDGAQAFYRGSTSHNHSMSADGRLIVFESYAENLVPEDNNGFGDIFVHDQFIGETKRVSVASDGSQGNHQSNTPASISLDGRYIRFASLADNLVPGDNDFAYDVFEHDLLTNETKFYTSNTNTRARKSDDGRYTVFTAPFSTPVEDYYDGSAERDVFIHDAILDEVIHVSKPIDGSNSLSDDRVFWNDYQISRDGRYVVYGSDASNLVSNDTNNIVDYFSYDRLLNTNTRISVSNDGYEGTLLSGRVPSFGVKAISPDSRFVVYQTNANGLVENDFDNSTDVFIYDREGVANPPVVKPAAIEVSATINAQSTQAEPGPAIVDIGNPGVWRYTVANTGDEPAMNVRVFEKKILPTADQSFTLLCDIGEIAARSIAICNNLSMIADGSYKAIISAQGADKNGSKIKSGIAAYYIGGVDSSAPSLSMEVLLNGSDNDNVAPGESLAIGDTATFTYNITNTGPVELTAVRIFDRTRSPVSSGWGRACEFSSLQAGETVSCEREATVETGDVERQISVQSFYQSEVIRAGDFSYYSGK